MILVYILLAIVVLFSIWGFFEDGIGGFITTFLIGAVVGGLVWMIVEAIGSSAHVTRTDTTYPVKIVSLNDGTGIHGEVYGGLFLVRGSVDDTQHFSYYRDVGNGSYVLEKRPAPQSSIWTDATPETSRVDVTDHIVACKPAWWLICDGIDPVITFSHAAFHVPPNSIKNEFVLDAQ